MCFSDLKGSMSGKQIGAMVSENSISFSSVSIAMSRNLYLGSYLSCFLKSWILMSMCLASEEVDKSCSPSRTNELNIITIKTIDT